MALPLGELARERLRGRARLTGIAPHPALRATFPRRVKALAVAGKFPAKVQSLRVRQIGCVIGTHTGPGAFGIAFFDKELVLE